MITLLNKKIQINSQTNPEGVVERAIVDVCEEMQIGEEKFGNILLAVTEAVDNAIEHGNKNNPDKKVELSYQSSPAEITFSITDQGHGGFDFTKVTDPTKPENPENAGRGILIMKMLSDKLEFLNEEKTVLLSFNLN
jgi:anti-sigma regulatory factor (Ser/Thr protein kinase)